LTELPAHTLVRLRVPMALADDACAALPHLLPKHPLCATDGDPRGLWMAPDTWLLASAGISVMALQQTVSSALAGLLHAATDLSDALVVLRLEGPGSRSVLSSGCGLNLSDREFPPGHCARTRFAHLPLLIHRSTAAECFELYVDRSYAAALWNWFL
jgi:sarcosine oxidase subunit gamma